MRVHCPESRGGEKCRAHLVLEGVCGTRFALASAECCDHLKMGCLKAIDKGTEQLPQRAKGACLLSVKILPCNSDFIGLLRVGGSEAAAKAMSSDGSGAILARQELVQRALGAFLLGGSRGKGGRGSRPVVSAQVGRVIILIRTELHYSRC